MKRFLLVIGLLLFAGVATHFYFFPPEREVKDEVRETNEEELIEEEESGGYVTFWFDDGLLSTYEVAYPALEERGWEGALAIVAGREIALEKFEPEGDSIMSWDQVRELEEKGWEISSHSMTHTNLSEVRDNDSLKKEIITSKEILEEKDFEVNSFVFPYGDPGNEVVYDLVMENYSYWRLTTSGVNSVPSTKRLETLFLTECADREEIDKWIEKTEEKSGWLIIVLHSILEEPIGWWQQTPEQFNMVLEAVEESSLEIVLPKDIFEKYGYKEDCLSNVEINEVPRTVISESDFNDNQVEIVIPSINVRTSLKLAFSEGEEIDFSYLDDHPVMISENESPFLSSLGEYGTGLILCHRNLFFRELDKLEKEEEFMIVKNDREIVYEVFDSIEVAPDDVWEQVKEIHEKGLSAEESNVILMTCTPYGLGWDRLLVFGRTVENMN